MKIIKQNDSAGGLIFKQNTNGKAMKQNYNFGYCYSPIFNGDIYRINKMIGETHPVLTLISIVKRGTTSLTNGINPYIASSSSFATYYRMSLETHLRMYDNNVQVGGSAFNTTSPAKAIMAHRIGTNERFRFGASHLTTSGVFDSALTVSSPSKTLALTEFKGTSIYEASARHAINRLVAFSRSLSNSEIDYFINNMLGNELLNTSGLLFDINFSEAKEINGIVQMEDVSGNGYHAQLLGLPVGTNEEKILYIKNNMLIQW